MLTFRTAPLVKMPKNLHIFQLADALPGQMRPWIDSRRPLNMAINWIQLSRIAKGELTPRTYKISHIEVKARGFDNWDCYYSAAYLPIVSQRFVDALGEYMQDCFELLEIYINDVKYYLLRIIRRIDCIDLKKSKVRYSEVDGSVQAISAYKFKTELLKSKQIFTISEFSRVFVTDEIRTLSINSKLKGVYFISTDGTRSFSPE